MNGRWWYIQSEWVLRLSDDVSLSTSSSSSSRAANSMSRSSARLPQLWGPAPFLRMDLSRPDFDSERSLIMARGNEERAVRVMIKICSSWRSCVVGVMLWSLSCYCGVYIGLHPCLGVRKHQITNAKVPEPSILSSFFVPLILPQCHSLPYVLLQPSIQFVF